MIVRTGARIIDYGPTPGPEHSKTAITGVIVVPDSPQAIRRAQEREKKARCREKADAA